MRKKPSAPTADNVATAGPPAGVPAANVTSRVDPPHVSQSVGAALAAELEPLDGERGIGHGEADAMAMALEQVRTQAAQLATHLRKQQASVDRREAELNARLAALDGQVRSARLWLVEREQDLASQQAACEQERQALAARQAELEAAEHSAHEQRRVDLEQYDATLQERQHQLDQRQQQLDQRQDQIDQTAARLAAQIALGQKAAGLQEALSKLESRREHLDQAEKLLAVREAEIEAQCAELTDQRAALVEESDAERRRLADERRQALAELDKEKAKLKRRRDDLDARKTALKRLRSDVVRTQRETLEMRLATEELWARLCGTAAPAALTQSLAQLRAKWADGQRLAEQEMADERAQLEALGRRLAHEHARLAEQKRQTQLWARAREEQIDQQAARLVAREQDLDRQETEFNELGKRWEIQRHELEREIRRLLAQLRSAQSAA